MLKSSSASSLFIERISSQVFTFAVVSKFGVEQWGEIAWILLNLSTANMLVSIFYFNGLSIRVKKSLPSFHPFYISLSYILISILTLIIICLAHFSSPYSSKFSVLLSGLYFFSVCGKSLLDTYLRAVGRFEYFCKYLNINALITFSSCIIIYLNYDSLSLWFGITDIALVMLSIAELIPMIYLYFVYRKKSLLSHKIFTTSIRRLLTVIKHFFNRSFSCGLPSLGSLLRQYLFFWIVEFQFGNSVLGSIRILISFIMPFQILTSSFFAKNIKFFPISYDKFSCPKESSSALSQLELNYKAHLFRLLILAIICLPLVMMATYLYKIPQYSYLAFPALISFVLISFTSQYVLHFNRFVKLVFFEPKSIYIILSSFLPLAVLVIPLVLISPPILIVFCFYSFSLVLSVFFNSSFLRLFYPSVNPLFQRLIQKAFASSLQLFSLLALYSISTFLFLG